MGKWNCVGTGKISENGDAGREAELPRPPSVVGFGVEDGTEAALYVPIQAYGETYSLCTGFQRGTIFPGLDKPFYGASGEVNCRGQAN